MTWWTLTPVWPSPSSTSRILSARRRGWNRTDHRWRVAQRISCIYTRICCSRFHDLPLKVWLCNGNAFTCKASLHCCVFFCVFLFNRRGRPYSRHWRAWTWTAAQWRTWVWTSPFQDSPTLSWRRAARTSQSRSTTWRSTSGYVWYSHAVFHHFMSVLMF